MGAELAGIVTDKKRLPDLAILVVSCDKYSDLWEPFFTLFKRFWPDCPFKIYLLSNEKECNIRGVNNILIGNDISWSDNLNKGLNSIGEKYVLLLMEDLLLRKQVDTPRILSMLAEVLSWDPNYFRLMPPPILKEAKRGDKIRVIPARTDYRASVVLSVWKRSFLVTLLRPGENAWDFEYNGSERCDIYDGFYYSEYAPIDIINSVIKGKWTRGAISEMRRLGININQDKRKVQTLGEEFEQLLRLTARWPLSFFPYMKRRSTRNFIRKMLYLKDRP